MLFWKGWYMGVVSSINNDGAVQYVFGDTLWVTYHIGDFTLVCPD